MAKDGTNRGGARAGAGRKKKALSEKIAEGNPGHRPLTMIDSSAMEGVDMPPPSDYLSAMQRCNGRCGYAAAFGLFIRNAA